MRKIEFIVLHTTASHQSATVEDIRAGWRARGWGETPGYHILITPDGVAHRLAPDASVTNGVAGYNSKCLHVCYVGGVVGRKLTPTDNRTDAQRQTMAEVVAAWVRLHPAAKVQGHRDFSPDLDGDGQIEPFEYMKACPCFNGADWWNNAKKAFPDLAHTPDVPDPEAPKKKKPAPQAPPVS